MSISVTELRVGTLFKYLDGSIYQVLKYEHIKKGRGGAIIKLKVKSVKSKAIKEISLKSGGKVDEVEGLKRPMKFVFMDRRHQVIVLSDPQTQSRSKVPLGVVDENILRLLKEGTGVIALYLPETDEFSSIELPPTVALKIVETTSSEKGDTAGSARKKATLETGASIQVPMFIKEGDLIKVNTQSGAYMERVTAI